MSLDRPEESSDPYDLWRDALPEEVRAAGRKPAAPAEAPPGSAVPARPRRPSPVKSDSSGTIPLLAFLLLAAPFAALMLTGVQEEGAPPLQRSATHVATSPQKSVERAPPTAVRVPPPAAPAASARPVVSSPLPAAPPLDPPLPDALISAPPPSAVPAGSVEPAADDVKTADACDGGAAKPPSFRQNLPPPPRLDLALLGIPEPGGARIVMGFECSEVRPVAAAGANHFVIDWQGESYKWFLFRLEGAKGRTIRIDLKDVENLKRNPKATVNPVYSYVKDVNALEAFETREIPHLLPPVKARNGPMIPDTRGQKWHFIPNVWVEGATLCFEQRFDQDSAYVALRYPYTYTYNENLFRRLEHTPGVQTYVLGKSKEGRPIRLAKIASGSALAIRSKPTVLIYAREHGHENDGSWAAAGAVSFLLSDNPDAVLIRNRFVFLMIPVLDPDGAVYGTYDRITHSFVSPITTPESEAVAGWLKAWVDKGNRIDLAFNLHNWSAIGPPHVVCAKVEPAEARLAESMQLQDFVLDQLHGYDVHKAPWLTKHDNFRLYGWLASYYGTLPMAYEVNGQTPARHLTIEELRGIGAGIVRACGKYLQSAPWSDLARQIEAVRAQREARWKIYGDELKGENALAAEKWCAVMPSLKDLIPIPVGN